MRNMSLKQSHVWPLRVDQGQLGVTINTLVATTGLSKEDHGQVVLTCDSENVTTVSRGNYICYTNEADNFFTAKRY